MATPITCEEADRILWDKYGKSWMRLGKNRTWTRKDHHLLRCDRRAKRENRWIN